MDRIESKSVGIFLPAFANEFVSREATEGLESFCEVVSGHEVCQVGSNLFVAVVVVALNGGLFDGSIHTLDLSVCPWLIGLVRR